MQPHPSPEQRAAEDKCMRALEMKYSRMLKKRLVIEQERMLKEEPRLANMTVDEIIAEDEMNRATCVLCGTVLKSYEHMLQHKDMLKCRKRQAANKGETYIPEKERPVHCDICDKTVQQQRWNSHIQSQAHKDNCDRKDDKLFECTVCNKKFTRGQRPKRMLQKHLISCKKHGRLCRESDDNMRKHYEIIKRYAFKNVPRLKNVKVI
jgi:hypothetical protein